MMDCYRVTDTIYVKNGLPQHQRADNTAVFCIVKLVLVCMVHPMYDRLR